MGKLILSVFCFVLLFLSCKKTGKQERVSGMIQAHSESTLYFKPAYEQPRFHYDYPTCFHDPLEIKRDNENLAMARLIPREQLQFHPWSMPLLFSMDSVLLHFYPGYLFRDNCYGENEGVFTCWKISGKPFHQKQWLTDENIESFPEKDGNETRLLDTISWQMADGKSFLLVSFSSFCRSQEACPQMTGRFSPAWLGMALFRKGNEKWELVAFDPGLEFCGQFGTADRPSFVRVSRSSFLLKVYDHDQGGGSPYWEMFTLYRISGGKILPASEKINSGVWNWMTDWHTQVYSSDSLSDEMYPAIKLISEGQLLRSEADMIGENCLVPEAAPYLKNNDALKFTRTKTLKYINGKYVVVKTVFRGDTSWVPN